MTPYSIVKVKNTASKSSQDLEFDGDERDVGEEEEKEEEEGITKDAMIKVRRYIMTVCFVRLWSCGI
jgi:hypothetical protein